MNEVDVGYYAPRFQITINGQVYEAEIAQTVLNVSVEQEVNKTNSFSFEVQDDFIHADGNGQSQDGKFQWLGTDIFKYGNEVSVAFGYLSNLKTLVEGKIQKIDAKFFEGNAPTFTVAGADKAYEFLTLPSETKVFNQKTHSQMVQEIATQTKPSLRALVDETNEVIPRKIKKGGETYLTFLMELVEANEGYEFALSGRDLIFQKKKKGQSPDIRLEWGKSLINFQPSLNTTQATTEVVVRAWDGAQKKMIEGRAKAGEEQAQEPGKKLASQIAQEIFGDVVTVVTDKPVRTEAEAKKEAKAILEKAGDSFITATGETVGLPDLLPGKCLDLQGLGAWFSGKYYVVKVTHKIDQNGYRSTFEAHRNAL